MSQVNLDIDTTILTNSEKISYPNAIEEQLIPDLFSKEKNNRRQVTKKKQTDYLNQIKQKNFHSRQKVSEPFANQVDKKIFKSYIITSSPTSPRMLGPIKSYNFSFMFFLPLLSIIIFIILKHVKGQVR